MCSKTRDREDSVGLKISKMLGRHCSSPSPTSRPAALEALDGLEVTRCGGFAGMTDSCHGMSKLLQLDGHHPAGDRAAVADE